MIGGKPVQQLATRRHRLIRHMITAVAPFRMPEINYRVYEGIAAHYQHVGTCDLECQVTLGVSGSIHDAQTRDDLVTAFNGFDPAFDGRVIASGAGDKAGAFGW